MAHDVFISYSNRDSQIANALCHMLEEDKIKCWMAPRDISLGDVWADAIAAAIPKAKVLIILLSINSNSSKQVLREIELAVHNNVVVLPVRIEDIMPTGGMSYYLSTTHWIDAIDESIENKISAIINRIRNILDGVESGEAYQPRADNPSGAIVSDIKKPRKAKLQKMIIGITAAVLLTAAGLTLFLMRDVIFAKQEELNTMTAAITPSPSIYLTPEMELNTTSGYKATAIPTATPKYIPVAYVPEDFGYDPEMEVDIPNETLRNAIVQTLENAGTPIEGYISVEDMFHIKEIFVVKDYDIEPVRRLNEKHILENEDAIITNGIIDDIEGMQYAKNMRAFVYINGDDLEGVSDPSPFSELYNLEILFLPSLQIKDLSALAELKNIWSLYLYGSTASDISILSNFKTLTNLALQGSLNITDISAISVLSHLEELDIVRCTGLKDVSYLQNSNMIKNIKYISMWKTDIDNIDFLSDAYNLERLDIRYLRIPDISVLENLNLEDLWLDIDTYNNNIDTINILITNGCNVYPDQS